MKLRKVFIKNLLPLLSLCSFTALETAAQKSNKYYTGDNTRENTFNKISKSAQRASRDLTTLPSSISLRQYAPVPGYQSMHGTCVAWSAGYAARTISYCILHNITAPETIKSVAFSPSYLYYYIKTPGDKDCTLGAEIEPALKALKDTGDVLQANATDCMSRIDSTSFHAGKNYIIKAYTALTNTFGKITKNEVLSIKKSLSEKKPVISSLKCLSSFYNVGKDGMWKLNDADEDEGNHAVCLIGYDDNKAGGAFEVMNSWGTDWGSNGFFWLTYDQIMKYGSYALELMDRESYDASITRDLGEPQLKGSLDFVLTDDFGNDINSIPVEQIPLPAQDSSNAFGNYQLAGSFGGDTKFKIKFTTNAPAFVYIFSIDNNNVVSTLFPYAANVSPAINSMNATVYLPSELKHYTLHADASNDRICVLYSKSPIDFDVLKNKIVQSSGNVYNTITQLYSNRIIPLKNISFTGNAINFNSYAGEQELICFFIDMNHQ